MTAPTADDLRALVCACGHGALTSHLNTRPYQWNCVLCDCPLDPFDVLAASGLFDQARADGYAEGRAMADMIHDAALDPLLAITKEAAQREVIEAVEAIRPRYCAGAMMFDRDTLRTVLARFGGDPS